MRSTCLVRKGRANWHCTRRMFHGLPPWEAQQGNNLTAVTDGDCRVGLVTQQPRFHHVHVYRSRVGDAWDAPRESATVEAPCV